MPPGRSGPTARERAAESRAGTFVLEAVKFLRTLPKELADVNRIQAMDWIATAPRHMDWPYCPPDHELLLDVVTTDGVGYVIRYGGADVMLPPVPHDDPLFVPIQPPLPISRVDVSMCGLLLFTGLLREIVIVCNLRFEERIMFDVRATKQRALAGAPECELRLVTWHWGSETPGPVVSRSSAVDATNSGNRASERGDLTEALRLHDEALRLDPKLALAWSNKAFVLSAQGRMEASLEAAQRAVALDDKLVVAWINKSNAEISLHRFPAALESARRGLVLDERSAALHFNAGTAADRTYKQPLAVVHFRAFLAAATPAMKNEVAEVTRRLAILDRK